MTSLAVLAGGVSRHGAECPCETCMAEYSPARPASTAACPPADTRPRHNFRLPDGTVVAIIFDHGDPIPPTMTYQLAGGRVVIATRMQPAPFRVAPPPRVLTLSEGQDVAFRWREDAGGVSFADQDALCELVLTLDTKPHQALAETRTALVAMSQFRDQAQAELAAARELHLHSEELLFAARAEVAALQLELMRSIVLPAPSRDHQAQER